MILPRLALVAALVLVPAGIGGAAWSPSVQVSAGEGYFATAAMDASGHATVAWTSPGLGSQLVQAARGTGGTWSAPADLSPASGFSAVAPRLAVDAAGTVTAAWRYDVLVLGLGAGAAQATAGAWAPYTPLSPSTEDAGVPVVAAGPPGSAMVAWTSGAAGSSRVLVASSSPAGWSAPATITQVTAPDSLADLQLAMNASGTAVATWLHWDNVANTAVREWARLTPAGWSPVGVVAAVAAVGGDQSALVIDAGGAATAVWQEAAGAGATVHAATLAPGATAWSTAADIGVVAATIAGPAATVDAAGTVTAAWARASGGTSTLTVARAVNGAWARARDVASADGIGAPALAAAGDGSVIAAWPRTTAGGGTLAAARFADGAWGDPIDIAPTTPTAPMHASVAAGAAGNAVATWTDITQGAPVRAAWFTAPVPPAPVAPTAASMRMALSTAGRRVVAGSRLRVQARVAARGAQASRVRACIAIPPGLAALPARGLMRAGRTACRDLGDIAAGRERTGTFTLQARTTRARVVRITGRATSASTTPASVTARPARVVVLPAHPVPVTG